MKHKVIYDTKIIVLDLDFFVINNLNFDEIFSIQKIIKQLSANQNLFLLTEAPHYFVLKIIESWDLKTGYLILNSGSCIYNISSKKIIYENYIDSDLAKIITKQSIWNNLNFVLNTKDNQSYIYRLNSWLIRKYKTDLKRLIFSEYQVLNVWDNIVTIINNNSIYNIEIFFHEYKNKIRKQKIKFFLNNLLECCKFNYLIIECVVYIYPIDSDKLTHITRISQEKNINLNNNLLYLAVNQCDSKILLFSYFSIVSEQLKEFIEIKHLNQITLFLKFGLINWVEWLNNNSYLWTEPVEQKYKILINNAKCSEIKRYELERMINGTYKSFYFNPINKYISIVEFSLKNNHRFKFVKKDINLSEVTQWLVWPTQISMVINLFLEKAPNLKR